MDDLVAAWRRLVAPYTSSSDAEATGRGLLDCWCQPHRRYHDLAHLRDILSSIDDLADTAADLDAVRLAAWYHDAVYDGTADDEELSAQKAESDLARLGMAPELVAEVARLVRMTVEHNPAPGDTNAEVLSDADLSSLAVPPERYRRNSANIRSEYAHVSDVDFRTGRASIIAAMLAAPMLYRTVTARQRWEDAARANLRAELSALTAPSDAADR